MSDQRDTIAEKIQAAINGGAQGYARGGAVERDTIAEKIDAALHMAEGGRVRRAPIPDRAEEARRELPSDTLARLRATYRTPGTAFTSQNFRDASAVTNLNPDSRPRYAEGGEVKRGPQRRIPLPNLVDMPKARPWQDRLREDAEGASRFAGNVVGAVVDEAREDPVMFGASMLPFGASAVETWRDGAPSGETFAWDAGFAALPFAKPIGRAALAGAKRVALPAAAAGTAMVAAPSEAEAAGPLNQIKRFREVLRGGRERVDQRLPSGFFSPAARAVEAAPQDMTGPQWQNYLKGREVMVDGQRFPVRGDEIEFTGLNSLLTGYGDKTVPRAEVLDFLAGIKPQSVYNEELDQLYKTAARRGLSDAENERLAQLQAAAMPDRPHIAHRGAEYPEFTQPGASQYSSYQLPGERENYVETLTRMPNLDYRAPHFGGQGNNRGLVSHSRVSSRTLPDGERAVHIDEMQSDLHSDARKAGGYRGDVKEDGLPPGFRFAQNGEYVTIQDERGRSLTGGRTREEALAEFARESHTRNRPPRAPYQDRYHEIEFNKALVRAANEDADYVTWTTGAQQAQRWGRDADNPGGYGNVYDRLTGKYAEQLARRFPGAEVGQRELTRIGTAQSLEARVDELAQQIWEDSPAFMTLDPEEVQRFGRMVQSSGNINNVLRSNEYAILEESMIENVVRDGIFDTRNEAARAIRHELHDAIPQFLNLKNEGPPSQTVHSMRLTPEMKAWIKKNGLPIMSVGGVGAAMTAEDHLREAMPRGDGEHAEFAEGGAVRADDLGSEIEALLERAGKARPNTITGTAQFDGPEITVPKVWKSAPDHPPTMLAYITPEEAELLSRADLHGSGVSKERHYGPGGVPSFNGNGSTGDGYGGGGDAGPGADGGDGMGAGSQGLSAGANAAAQAEAAAAAAAGYAANGDVGMAEAMGGMADSLGAQAAAEGYGSKGTNTFDASNAWGNTFSENLAYGGFGVAARGAVNNAINNALSNPITTAINAVVGLTPVGTLNTISGLIGGPTIGSVATAAGRGIGNALGVSGAQGVSNSVGASNVSLGGSYSAADVGGGNDERIMQMINAGLSELAPVS